MQELEARGQERGVGGLRGLRVPLHDVAVAGDGRVVVVAAGERARRGEQILRGAILRRGAVEVEARRFHVLCTGAHASVGLRALLLHRRESGREAQRGQRVVQLSGIAEDVRPIDELLAREGVLGVVLREQHIGAGGERQIRRLQHEPARVRGERGLGRRGELRADRARFGLLKARPPLEPEHHGARLRGVRFVGGLHVRARGRELVLGVARVAREVRRRVRRRPGQGVGLGARVENGVGQRGKHHFEPVEPRERGRAIPQRKGHAGARELHVGRVALGRGHGVDGLRGLVEAITAHQLGERGRRRRCRVGVGRKQRGAAIDGSFATRRRVQRRVVSPARENDEEKCWRPLHLAEDNPTWGLATRVSRSRAREPPGSSSGASPDRRRPTCRRGHRAAPPTP